MKSEKIALASETYALEITNENKQCESLRLERRVAIAAFQAGADLVNDYWQEKTRWIPITERLPDVRKNEYPIYTKNERGKDDYDIILIDNQLSLEYLKKCFTHWKEIE